jgi:hypothetical protein
MAAVRHEEPPTANTAISTAERVIPKTARAAAEVICLAFIAMSFVIRGAAY